MPKQRPKPRTVTFFEPRSAPQREAKRRALDAIALKRRNPEISLTEAARRSGTTLKTVRRYGGSVLEVRCGRLDVAPRDRIPRLLRFLTERGQIDLRVTNSRDASRIARYHNAVRKYLVTRDLKHLKPFVGKSVKVGKERYPFVTDPAALNRLARAGEIHFLDLYAKGGAA